MCFIIDPTVTSLNKRVVWKVFQRQDGVISSLFLKAIYPKGVRVERSAGATKLPLPAQYGNRMHSSHGVYVYTSKRAALRMAREWDNTYIAKLSVYPAEFLHSDGGDVAAYTSATRVGNFIKVTPAKD